MFIVELIQSSNMTDDSFVFFIFIIQAMVCAMATTIYVPPYNMGPMATPNGLQYPDESYAYTQLQGSLRTLFAAITAEILAVRGVEDYLQQYQEQPLVYGSVYSMKLEALEKAKQNLKDAYMNANQDYLNYIQEATAYPSVDSSEDLISKYAL